MAAAVASWETLLLVLVEVECAVGGGADEFAARADVELAVDAGQVRLDCRDCGVELGCDFSVLTSGGDEDRDASFGGGELVAIAAWPRIRPAKLSLGLLEPEGGAELGEDLRSLRQWLGGLSALTEPPLGVSGDEKSAAAIEWRPDCGESARCAAASVAAAPASRRARSSERGRVGRRECPAVAECCGKRFEPRDDSVGFVEAVEGDEALDQIGEQRQVAGFADPGRIEGRLCLCQRRIGALSVASGELEQAEQPVETGWRDFLIV